MTTEELRGYIENLIKPLITGEFSVELSVDEIGTLYTIKINKDDFGRLIGKNGKTIGALRIMVRAIGQSHGIRASVKVPDII